MESTICCENSFIASTSLIASAFSFAVFGSSGLTSAAFCAGAGAGRLCANGVETIAAVRLRERIHLRARIHRTSRRAG